MKKLIQTNSDTPWVPKPSENRLYITDEMPVPETWGTAFGFAFQDDRLLLTRLRHRDWDIPGGMIEPGETPGEAAAREVWEETYARVEIVELIGVQEIELLGPRPDKDKYKWPYPISTQIYFLVQLIELASFEENSESFDRGFMAPNQARKLPTMSNHAEIYEEALRRVQSSRDG